jgi:oxalate decarboxylase/phosphoglucose isomerase-like protein (cupin superfamily)
MLPVMFETTGSTTVVDLSAHRLRFETGGNVHAAERRPSAGDQDWSLGAFHAETNGDVHSDHWERHPRGDEAVCCIRGAVTLVLRPSEPDETSEDVVRLLTGQASIVPRGRWHRLEVEEPTDLVAITLPDGTLFEKVEQPPGDNDVA